MILSENKLIVPGKRYKVSVKCISTRRLTTIEWLLLSCAQKFEKSDSMSSKNLKYAFEEVFQFQNSELLIKPCLKELQRIKVIKITGGDTFDYNKLTFADIDVTELGQHMLKDGLLPGDSREMPLDIYYNPLTGKMNHYDLSSSHGNESIEFGTAADYPADFPEQKIINELQSGAVGGGRFTASKFRIEEIENLLSSDWDSTITMTASVNEDGVITTNPEIIEKNVKNLIIKLFITKEITKDLVDIMPQIDTNHVKNIIGSGRIIKSTILDICRSGKILFMDAKMYDILKRNTASFKFNLLILFNDEEGFRIESGKKIIIHIPDKYEIENCVVINDKGAHVSLAKNTYIYEEQKIDVPVAYEDNRIIRGSKKTLIWIQGVIFNHLKDEIQYAALYTLPLFTSDISKCKDSLSKRWEPMALSEIVSEIESIHEVCELLNTEMLQIDIIADALIEKIDVSDYEMALSNIHKIIETKSIIKKSNSHRMMVEKIINHIKVPTTYRDLYMLLQSLGITSHDEALAFDDLIGNLYTRTIISDILTCMANGTFSKMPELFEYDVFFNDYAECIKNIELHVSGLKMFEINDRQTIKEAVYACPDIGSLQSFMAELQEKNSQLMHRSINVYHILKQTVPEKANAYSENIKLLEKYINQTVTLVYEKDDVVSNEELSESKAETVKKVYIIDTCALMHNPDIFLYFKDNEYIRIPTKVIDELGKIKDKRNSKYDAETSDTARIIAREIIRTYLPLFNRENKLRLMIENSALNLLPKELDPIVPDNQILSVALKYKGWETYIISDDGVFLLTAMAQKIESINGNQFKELHKDSFKTLEERIKEANSAKNIKPEISETKKENEITTEICNAIPEKISITTGDQNIETNVENTDTQIPAPEEKTEQLSIDDMSIRELKKYVPDFDDKIISFLESFHITTIGDFRQLNETKVKSLKVKIGKQIVYKNTVIRAVKQMDSIIPKIRLKK